MSSCCDLLESPLGIITIVACENGINALFFGDVSGTFQSDCNVEVHKIMNHCKIELQEYFDGNRFTFTVPLQISGTAFQQKVWNALHEIPYGKTLSYKELARNIGNEKACRAIGLANNRNPLPILIPCHRVIGSSGKMVGYAGEIWRKEWLLMHEQNNAMKMCATD